MEPLGRTSVSRDVRQCAAATSVEAVKELMEKNGIRYFVTPLPNCGEPNMPRLTEFINRYTEERFRGGCLYVAEMKSGAELLAP